MIKFYFKETFKAIKSSKISFFVTFGIVFIAICFLFTSLILVSMSNQIDTKLKSNLAVNLFIKENVKNKEIESLAKTIRKLSFVNTAKIISKDEAKKKFINETGEDFTSILEINPLPISINIKFNPTEVNENFLKREVKKFSKISIVEDVVFENSSTFLILNYLNSSKKIIYTISFLLALLSLYLIYTTNIIIMNSRVETFETMKLVGANLKTLKIPIYFYGLLLGILSAIFASGVFYVITIFIKRIYPSMDFKSAYIAINVLILMIGIFLGLTGSFFSAKKINLKINKF